MKDEVSGVGVLVFGTHRGRRDAAGLQEPYQYRGDVDAELIAEVKAEVALDQETRDANWDARKIADDTRALRRIYGPPTGNRVSEDWLSEQDEAWRTCARWVEFPKGPGAFVPRLLLDMGRPEWPEVLHQAVLDRREREAVAAGKPAWHAILAKWPSGDRIMMNLKGDGEIPASLEAGR